MDALVFANGLLGAVSCLAQLIERANLIIAADGGANHCQKLEILPDILIGDLDSIHPQLLTQYKDRGVEIISYPVKKNATDLELCLNEAMDRGARKISLIAAIGGRWDMSLGNILLAASVKYQGIKVSLYSEESSMHILHPRNLHRIVSSPGQRVSLLPLHGDVSGITLSGFEFPLTNHTLRAGSSLGVSNVAMSSEATILHRKGILLCIESEGDR